MGLFTYRTLTRVITPLEIATQVNKLEKKYFASDLVLSVKKNLNILENSNCLSSYLLNSEREIAGFLITHIVAVDDYISLCVRDCSEENILTTPLSDSDKSCFYISSLVCFNPFRIGQLFVSVFNQMVNTNKLQFIFAMSCNQYGGQFLQRSNFKVSGYKYRDSYPIYIHKERSMCSDLMNYQHRLNSRLSSSSTQPLFQTVLG